MIIQNSKDLFSAVESASRVAALVIGAVWAYYKFIKDRIYRPRLDIQIQPSRLSVANHMFLLCRISVQNIGATRVRIVQQGTAFKVSSGRLPRSAFVEPSWRVEGAYEIFADHGWIESAEVIRHDVLISLDGTQAVAMLLELHLVCKMLRNQIGVHGRCIDPPPTDNA